MSLPLRRTALPRLVLLVLCVFTSYTAPAVAAGFRSPIDGGTITSGCNFNDRPCASKSGYYHTGVDWNGGPQVRAVADGVIERIQPNDNTDSGFGRTVILRHETTAGKVYSQYSHMASFAAGLVPGSCVTGGQQFGTVGGSGYGQEGYWSPHLHLEIKDAAVLTNPGNGGPYFGYTPQPAQGYGYRDPNAFYPDKVSTSQECGIVFDSPIVSSSNVLQVTQGDTVRAIFQARYRGLLPLECGWINLGTRNDGEALFRADQAGPWPASQWRNPNRVAALDCDRQIQPGATGKWAPEFFSPPGTPPGTYLTGEYHPVYDRPSGGGHSNLNVPISLNVVPKGGPGPGKPGQGKPTIAQKYAACLKGARARPTKNARAKAKRACRADYRRSLLNSCLKKAKKVESARARARARKNCRRKYATRK